MQARLCASVFAGTQELPVDEEMVKTARYDASVYIDQFEHNAKRVRSLVDYFRYMDDLAKVIGCHVPFKRYFFLRPRLWLHIVYGPTQATQFRLNGPGKK